MICSVNNKDGNASSSPSESANILAQFFSSTFIQEPLGPLPQDCYNPTPPIIPSNDDHCISVTDVKCSLKNLNHFKSLGPDGIHPKLLSTLSADENFVLALTILFNKCLECGKIPTIWKSANVTPIHKKGPLKDPSNYRPISLTCILSKIYEKFVRDKILEYVTPIITNKQHGFVPGRSCLSNLLEFMDAINDMTLNGEFVDIVYMDFQKAFDTVPHYRLLVKLMDYGISSNLINVVADFLEGRSFRVRVGDSYSDNCGVTSGVPQGSVLGPLLFLIYINDLPEGIRNKIFMFADDVKLAGPCSTPVINQRDIDYMSNWQDKWLLKFNTDDGKCKIMHTGKRNPHHEYFLNGIQLPTVDTEKDLGVNVTCNLQWEHHIELAVNKAKSVVAWVSRSVISRDPKVMVNIYKSLVRPHLEYCVQLWSPSPRHGNWNLIMKLEDVQRQYTRLIDGVGLLKYEDRLNRLGLTTLLERRARGDLIEAFRILSGIANYGGNLFNYKDNATRRGLHLVFGTTSSTANAHNFFSKRVVNYWNGLPQYVKASLSVNSFKSKLEEYKVNYFNTTGNYWELSQEIFNRIQDGDRESHRNYLLENPYVAKRKGINIKV